MNETEYVEAMGTLCLFCGSEQIEGGPVEIDDGRAWQHMKCNDCDSEWDDLYDLSGCANEQDGRPVPICRTELIQLCQNFLTTTDADVGSCVQAASQRIGRLQAQAYLARMEAK